jgi:hypothetical protein
MKLEWQDHHNERFALAVKRRVSSRPTGKARERPAA